MVKKEYYYYPMTNVFVLKTLLDCLVISFAIKDLSFLKEIRMLLKDIRYYECKMFLSVRHKIIFFFDKIHLLKLIFFINLNMLKSIRIRTKIRIFFYGGLLKTMKK
jgi:hypothetical protein